MLTDGIAVRVRGIDSLQPTACRGVTEMIVAILAHSSQREPKGDMHTHCSQTLHLTRVMAGCCFLSKGGATNESKGTKAPSSGIPFYI